MSLTISPEFPCLIVEDDGSLGSLIDLSYWTDDVDMWFWGGRDAYLIDQRGWRFEQVCERSSDGRPLDVPLWKFCAECDAGFVRELLEGDTGITSKVPGSRISTLDFCGAEQYVREVIAIVVEVDAQ